MRDISLFQDAHGKDLKKSEFVGKLLEIGAGDCKTLYAHTGITFGLPHPGLSKRSLVEHLYDCLMSLNVENICFPTFTFSFCNGLDYSVNKSKTQMGTINEFARKQPEFERSEDPLMSVAVSGPNTDLLAKRSRDSIGKLSTFEALKNSTDAKFLFFGVQLGDCFTYMHYLEWLAGVPYRYLREFKGSVTNSEGDVRKETYTLFVRYANVFPNQASHIYSNNLLSLGFLKTAKLGNSEISVVSETDASRIYLEMLKSDPNVFIQEPFNPSIADKSFTTNGNMVAL
jgi:aminoglycoside 3-N-acetyltransferase